MKSVKVLFSNDSISSDSKLVEINNFKITIKNQSSLICNFIFDNFSGCLFDLEIINSEVTIVERFLSDLKQYQLNINIDETSKLKRFSFFIDNKNSTSVTRTVNTYGNYESMQIDLGDININCVENINLLKSEATGSVINAIYAQNKDDKKYLTTFNHLMTSTISNCKIFAICDNYAQVLINTDAYIKNGAAKSKAQQEGRIINVSEFSYGSILPNLHIDENDVEASHSCSVGSVNQDHLYYLQARGFNEKQAQSVLMKSYFTPVIANIDDPSLKTEVEDALNKRIG